MFATTPPKRKNLAIHHTRLQKNATCRHIQFCHPLIRRRVIFLYRLHAGPLNECRSADGIDSLIHNFSRKTGSSRRHVRFRAP